MIQNTLNLLVSQFLEHGLVSPTVAGNGSWFDHGRGQHNLFYDHSLSLKKLSKA